MKNRSKFFTVCWTLAVVTFAVFLNTVRPTDAGPVGVLLVFLLGLIVLWGMATALVWGFMKWRNYMLGRKREIQGAYGYGFVIALGLVMGVAMRSLGRLGTGEIVLLVSGMVVGCLIIIFWREK